MPGPFFKLRLRRAVREELENVRPRLSARQIRSRLDDLDDDVIERAISDAGATESVFAIENGVGAIGDGTILKAIMDFLKSDLGQALSKIILGFLI